MDQTRYRQCRNMFINPNADIFFILLIFFINYLLIFFILLWLAGWGGHPYTMGYALTMTGGAGDPEPGRCRRTDGKKWRCSRDAVADQKYCERHINRGRHRSRKHVEPHSNRLSSSTKSNTTTNVSKPASTTAATSASTQPQTNDLGMGLSASCSDPPLDRYNHIFELHSQCRWTSIISTLPVFWL